MRQCLYAAQIGAISIYFVSTNNSAFADTNSAPLSMQDFSSSYYENNMFMWLDDCSELAHECIEQGRYISYQLPTLDFLNDIALKKGSDQTYSFQWRQWQSTQRIRLLKGVSDIPSVLDPVAYREIWKQQKKQKSLPLSLIYYQFGNPIIQFWENNIRLIPNQHGGLESATEFELGWQLGNNISLLSSWYTKWVAEEQHQHQSDQLFSLVLDYKTGNNDFQLFTHYAFGESFQPREQPDPYWLAHAKVTWNWEQHLSPYLELRNLRDMNVISSTNHPIAGTEPDWNPEMRLGLNWSY